MVIKGHMRFANATDYVEMNADLKSIADQYGAESAAMIRPLQAKVLEYSNAGEYLASETLMEHALMIMEKIGSADEEIAEGYLALSRILRRHGRTELANNTLEMLVQRMVRKYIKHDPSQPNLGEPRSNATGK